MASPRKLKVVKSTPKVNKYAKQFGATKFFGSMPELAGGDFAAIRREMWEGPDGVNEPTAAYDRAAPRRRSDRSRAKKAPKHKGYDAKKYTGMIPGIAERMKEYLKTMRDDR